MVYPNVNVKTVQNAQLFIICFILYIYILAKSVIIIIFMYIHYRNFLNYRNQ